MQDARDAYNKAATTLRIELIEMNAQFNIKHNLADSVEQEIFNSAGQAHSSAASRAKLANLYSDYKLQPSYILANSEKNEYSRKQHKYAMWRRIYSCVSCNIWKSILCRGINC